MALEFDLQRMASHLESVLEKNREIITFGENELVFKTVKYGEPAVILEWPHLSVMPIRKTRELRTTRKYEIGFEIHLIIYHGQVSETHKIQKDTHRRAEALERYVIADRKWNFVDASDTTKDKVIHGVVTALDHPLIDVVGANQLWAGSRLVCEAISEEHF